MRYLQVKNFEKFQHYKDRRPPWIKLYRDLWSDPEFFSLTETERYFLISFFMIASQNENRIPDNPDWLKREMATKKAIPVERLLQAGWLKLVEQDASNVLAERKQSDSEPLAPSYQDASNVLALARSRETEKNKKSPTPLHDLRTDSAFALWAEAFSAQHLGTPYQHKKGDFVQLAALRKSFGMKNGDAPPDWNQAIANYLVSPREPHTLAELCVNYATFRTHALDRFNKPVESTTKTNSVRSVHDFL